MALKIDNQVVHATATETIMQNVEAFTAGTNGAITLGSELILGDIQETSMLSEIASLVGRRDVNADTENTPKNLSSRDENNIKLYWGTGSIEFKAVDAKRYGADAGAFSSAIGEQIGKGIIGYMLNNAIRGARASIESNAALVLGDGSGTITHSLLNTSLKPFGDARESVVCWVMNGSVYTDLVGAGLNVATSNVAGGVIADGSVGSLGRPVFMSDSDGLTTRNDADDADCTSVLGLSIEAVKIIESESREFLSDMVSGSENIKYRIQAEGSMALNVKGYSWKTASGINPTVSTLGTSANWEQKATDVKSTAGVMLKIA